MLRIAPAAVFALASLAAAGCGDDGDDGAFDPVAAFDPCFGVSVDGECFGDAIERCVTPTGAGLPFPHLTPCPSDTVCRDTPTGATCELIVACRHGDAECRGDRLADCVGGGWIETPCPRGCAATPLGAACRPDVRTSTYHGELTFEYKRVNAGWTDWDPVPTTARAAGLLILSVADGQLIDTTVTGATDADLGRFAIEAVVPEDVDGDDALIAVALRINDDGEAAFMVASPDLPAGTHDPATVGAEPSAWTWGWRRNNIPAGDVVLNRAGGGAAFLFEYLRYVYSVTQSLYGPRSDAPLVVWHGAGVDWSCGACFAALPLMFGSVPFGNQIWMPGGADEGYWSGAVTAHELGHWVMSTYGHSPGEGGQHIMGIPSHPGLAWSEGFATFFSAVVRGRNDYYDKQNGLFFWIDLAARAYGSGVPWRRPAAEHGLEQMIDENEVAVMLLRIASAPSTDFSAFLAALTSPRMTRSPFARGYLRRVWDGLDDDGWALPAYATDTSAPHLADFLDALVCSGAATADEVDAVTEPWAHYPYPSWAPLCSSGRAPVQVAWEPWEVLGDDTYLLRAAVRWHWSLEADLDLAIDLPRDVVVFDAEGPARVLAPADPGAATLTWWVHGPRVAVQQAALALDLRASTWGVSGRVPLRSHGDAAKPAPPTLDPSWPHDLRVRVGRYELDLGRALPAVAR